MRYQVTKTLTGVISDDPKEKMRHQVLWRDFLHKVNYIMGNPKYKEILLEMNATELVVREGGAPSDSQLPPTSD